jgi:hypothetical protein
MSIHVPVVGEQFMIKGLFPTSESKNLCAVKGDVRVDIGWVTMLLGQDNK